MEYLLGLVHLDMPECGFGRFGKGFESCWHNCHKGLCSQKYGIWKGSQWTPSDEGHLEDCK